MATVDDIQTPAAALARLRLGVVGDVDTLTDEDLNGEIAFVASFLFNQYPDIGGVASLATPAGSGSFAATDGDYFARAVGLLVAARLVEVVKAAKSGGATKIGDGNTTASWDQGLSAQAAIWQKDAVEALNYVSVISASLASQAGSHVGLVAAGPTSARLTARYGSAGAAVVALWEFAPFAWRGSSYALNGYGWGGGWT